MARIFCFTSTGNSLYVSKRIAEEIGGEVFSMAGKPIVCDDDVIGFVFPVFFWGLPITVREFLNAFDCANDAYLFAIATYGGFTQKGVIGEVNKILGQKGKALSYGRLIKSVENYLPGSTVNDNPDLHRETDNEINAAILEIIERKRIKIKKDTVLNGIIYRFYPAGKNKTPGRYFTVSNDCNGCENCMKICPRKNIVKQGEKPSFNNNCELCLSCLHICPHKAIDWKSKTKGKQRYLNPHITVSEIIAFNKDI